MKVQINQLSLQKNNMQTKKTSDIKPLETKSNFAFCANEAISNYNRVFANYKSNPDKWAYDFLNDERLQDESLKSVIDFNTCMQFCSKKPVFLSFDPSHFIDNVVSLINDDSLKDSSGNPLLDLSTYLDACKRYPALLCVAKKVLIPNLKETAFLLKDEMLSKNPSVQTDEKDIYAKALKSPLLFYKDKYEYMLAKKVLPYGIFNIEGIDVKRVLELYLKRNQGDIYSFDIPKDELSEEFIEFSELFAKRVTGEKNIFDINVR